MSKILLYGLLTLGLAACTRTLSEEKVAPQQAAAVNRSFVPERVLETGTRIGATMQDSLSSQRNKVGENIWAVVTNDVQDGYGYVVIPAGSAVEMKIMELSPATNVAQKDGKLLFSVSSVNVRGVVYQVRADMDSVQHRLLDRGITMGDVATVGVGAAAGAVAGKVIGKTTEAAVIGGVIGAGAGTAVAVTAQNRDVVVARGTPIVFTLTQRLAVPTNQISTSIQRYP